MGDDYSPPCLYDPVRLFSGSMLYTDWGGIMSTMATLTGQPLLQNIKPVPPEHLVGDLIQPGHRLFGLIWINPQRLGGTPCFYGTRVPLKNLFDYVESGLALDQFLDDFEGVT